MKMRSVTASVAALAVGAALLVPAVLATSAQAAPTAAPGAPDASGLVRLQDGEQGFGVVEPSGIGLLADSAYVEFPEGGGTWYHGVKNHEVYSNFYHYTRKHGSSVKDGDGHLDSSDIEGPRATSHASHKATLAGNTAYYRFG